MLRLNKTILKTLLLATTGTVISLGYTTVAQAGILTFNSKNPVDNATTRANWLSAIGITAPKNFVNFETGFTNGQNIAGMNGLLPGGLVITSSDNQAVIRSGSGSINGSNPVGSFALTHNDRASLTLDFSSRPVDYVGFQDIDHSGARGIITFTDGTSLDIRRLLDVTVADGDSAEFFGIFRNDLPRIVSIQLDATGDRLWGLDNIEYGAVPEPLTIVGAGTALGFGSFFKRRLSKNPNKSNKKA